MADVEYTALKSEKAQLKMYLATGENREKQLQKHLEEEKEGKKRKKRQRGCLCELLIPLTSYRLENQSYSLRNRMETYGVTQMTENWEMVILYILQIPLSMKADAL